MRLLKPEHLTPIVERLANRTLDADVEVGKVELSFRPAFPVLNIEVDSLTVLSHAFANLSPEERTALPAYADTLLTLDRFSGALDLGALIKRGEIGVRDVELIRPGVNIVLDRHGRGNFDIYQAAEDTVESSSSAPIPPFSISRFAMVEPREIRYFNAADSTDATVMLLHDIVLDGSATPLYTLRIDGHLLGPYPQQFLQAQDIHFGLDGRVRWAPLQPEMLALEEFTIKGAFATAHLSTELKYDSTLTVNSGRLENRTHSNRGRADSATRQHPPQLWPCTAYVCHRRSHRPDSKTDQALLSGHRQHTLYGHEYQHARLQYAIWKSRPSETRIRYRLIHKRQLP